MRLRRSAMRVVIVLAGFGLIAGAEIGARQSGAAPARPLAAIDAILEAFKTHRLIGLGDDHGSLRVGAFRVALLRDPRFPTLVHDVVVEFGSSRYQQTMDRYVGGDTVPDEDLRKVWENTTSPEGWDKPLYQEVFTAIRAVNAGLPKERHVRALLADPPIDWDAVKTAEDIRGWNRQRATFAADLIAREVIARKRRALIIFGDGHFQARTERPPRGLAALLSVQGGELLAIASNSGPLADFQPEVTAWPTPSIAFVRGTVIGAAGYDVFYGSLPPGEYWSANRRFDDHYDAVLYLGPTSANPRSTLTFPRCEQPDYVAMRVTRIEMAGARKRPGAPPPAERIRQACRPMNDTR